MGSKSWSNFNQKGLVGWQARISIFTCTAGLTRHRESGRSRNRVEAVGEGEWIGVGD